MLGPLSLLSEFNVNNKYHRRAGAASWNVDIVWLLLADRQMALRNFCMIS